MVDVKLRIRVFLQRLVQPTGACMVCMTAPTFANLASLPHWKLALQTGLGTGVLAVLLTLTPLGRVFAHRYGNAIAMGVLTAFADAWSHPGRFSSEYGEALLTGVVSGLLVLAGSYVLDPGIPLLRRVAGRFTKSGGPWRASTAHRGRLPTDTSHRSARATPPPAGGRD